jgi:hypothetical protein
MYDFTTQIDDPAVAVKDWTAGAGVLGDNTTTNKLTNK